MNRAYSEVEHRAAHQAVLAQVETMADRGAAERLSNYAKFIDPDVEMSGQRMAFDVQIRKAFPDRIQFLPELTVKTPRIHYQLSGPAQGYLQDDAFIMRIDGASVLSSGAVCFENNLFLRDIQFTPHYPNQGIGSSLIELFRASSFDPTTSTAVVQSEAVDDLPDDFVYLVLDGANSRYNYGHFIHDLLFQLPAIDQMRARYGDRLRLLVAGRRHHFPGFRFPMPDYIIAKLGLDGMIIHVDGRSMRFKHGYVASRPMTLHSLHGYSARYAKARVREALGISRLLASGPVYYMSRKDGGEARPIGNQDEVETLLEAKNIRPIVGTGQSPADMVEVFGQAGGLVGLHGAGLMNLLFADSTAPLIEIAPGPQVWNSIQMCATAWQHPYYRIPQLIERPGIVDCQMLAATLDVLL